MSIKQISVFLENKPGSLDEMTRVLAGADIDLRALSLAESSDFGIARMIVDDVYDTTTVLKEAGYVCSLTSVLAVRVPDEPGGLNKLLEVLNGAEINLEYMYAFLGGKDVTSAYMILRISDVEKAEAVLVSKHFMLVDQETISDL